MGTSRPPPAAGDACGNALQEVLSLAIPAGQAQASQFHVLQPDVRVPEQVRLMLGSQEDIQRYGSRRLQLAHPARWASAHGHQCERRPESAQAVPLRTPR